MRTTLARRRDFSCNHRYEVRAWTEAQNREVFGACFTPNGHGHNYELEVYLSGAVDTQSGMILNLVEVDAILSEVIKPVAGKHLNFEVAEFKDKVPTTELLAQFLFERCQKLFANTRGRLVKLRLYEYEDLWVDVWPE